MRRSPATSDPLIDKDIGKDSERLFKRIVNVAPPPIVAVGRQPADPAQRLILIKVAHCSDASIT